MKRTRSKKEKDSDSEESALSSDDDDIPLSQRNDLGRRKNYKWHLKEPMQSVRTRKCNTCTPTRNKAAIR